MRTPKGKTTIEYDWEPDQFDQSSWWTIFNCAISIYLERQKAIYLFGIEQQLKQKGEERQ